MAAGSAIAQNASVFGQSSLGQSSTQSSQPDCSDPTQQNDPSCQSGGSYGSAGAGMSAAQVQAQAAQAAASARMGANVYSDSGGFPQESAQQQQLDQILHRLPPEPPTDFQRLARESTGEMLPIFGRDLFLNPPSTFAPADQTNVTPEYVLGPGDEILLRLWGHNNFNGHLTVDRAGNVYVPEVGSIHVAGEHFSDVEEQFRQELTRTYRNFQFSVNLGRLRSIQVFVLGEARRPGSYTVSSLSTVLNALLVSGGPGVRGSLRNIEVRRAGAVAATVDLYDFILKGDKSKDVTLQSGDVLFIPTVGPQIAFGGSVRHPAIFEVKPDTTVNDVLGYAGGLSTTASESRLQVDRISDHRDRHSMTVTLNAAGLATQVADGDVLYAFPVLRGFEKSVTIRGNLANPGRFPFTPGMKLSDILPDRESLLTRDYWQQRNRLGLPSPLFEPLPMNNGQRMMSSQNSRQQGQTYVPQQQVLDSQGNVVYRSNGQPISAPVLPQDSYQNDGADAAGYAAGEVDSSAANQTDAASALPYGSNNSNGTGAYGTQGFAGQQTPGMTAQTGSQLNNGSLADEQETAEDRLAGAPKRRNEIRIPEPQIDWSYAVIERTDPETLRTSLIPFNLGKLVMQHDASEDRELQAGDIVTIVSQYDIHVPVDQQTKYVRIEGEIASAGVYSVGPDETLADVVRRAGGLTAKAYLFGSAFTRESARVQQQQRLDEYVQALTIQTERASTVRALSTTNPSLQGGQLAEERDMLAQLRQMRATGRVVLEFKPDSAGDATLPALQLENGDTFRVPSRPAIVSIVGAVYGQNVLLYDPARKVRDYLKLAGKPNRIADAHHSFIIRADGSVLSRDAAGGSAFENARVFPGDTIVVPEKPIKPSVLRDIIDYSQIFSQFALGAAAINVIQ